LIFDVGFLLHQGDQDNYWFNTVAS
jgi:hypothetical protein